MRRTWRFRDAHPSPLRGPRRAKLALEVAGRRPVGWGIVAGEMNLANETARALRKRLTPQEVKVWVKLRELKPLAFRFRRQVPIWPVHRRLCFAWQSNCRRDRWRPTRHA